MATFRLKPPFNTILVMCGFAACWLILIWAMGRGYDFTDDAYYLVWASAPHRYAWSVSEFGFLWHPLYQLVGGEIYAFRIAGAALLSGSAALFGWAIWRFVKQNLPRSTAPSVIIAIAAASFWNLFYWIPTPGYNELNLIGLLLYMAGLIFALRTTEIGQLIACAALSAAGLTITAFAKPTTALCGLVIGLLWLLILRPKRPILFTALACGFALLFLYVGILGIDSSIHAFIERKSGGLQLLQALSQTHGLQALYQSTVDPIVDLLRGGKHLSLALKILAGGLLWAILLQSFSDRFLIGKIIFNLVVAIVLSYSVRDWRSSGAFSPEYDIASISPLLLTIAVGISLLIRRPGQNNRTDSRAATVLAILMLCAAFSFSAGTNNRTLYHESLAAVFWFAALIILASTTTASSRNNLVSGAAVLTSLMTAGLLAGAIDNPYRLIAPISQQTELVRIGVRASPLLVDKITASYIVTLQGAANSHGFKSETPIIDLTGVSPGTVFALGGVAPARGWLNGGYPGSTASAHISLSQIKAADLRQAWILTTTENSVDKLPDELLQSLGLSFPVGYQNVGHACKGNPCIDNILWKPIAR